MKLAKLVVTSATLALLSGCSLLGFDDDEITYKQLQPINATVQPEVQWEVAVGDGVESYFSRLQPVVVGDLIIAAARDGLVSARQRSDGAAVWSVDARELVGADGDGWIFPSESFRINGGLSVNSSGSMVVLGTENGAVMALASSTGALLWHTSIQGEVLSKPAVDEGYVVVNTSAGNIVALREDTGEQAWSLGTDVPALSLRGNSSPSISSGGALFGTANGKLKVAVLETGQEAWEARLAIPKGATELQRLVDADVQPIIVGSNVYAIAYNGQLSAVELQTGRTVWQREYAAYRNMSYHLGRLYVTDSQDNVFAIDTQGGIEAWSNSDLTGRELTQPVRFKDFIVVGDRFGYLHFLSARSGEIVGRLATDGGVYAAPVVADDTLYIQLRDGSLLAVGS